MATLSGDQAAKAGFGREAVGAAIGDEAPAIIDELVQRVKSRVAPEQAAEAAEFVRQYHAFAAPEDLAERTADDLCGAAWSHWEFAQVFEPGAPKLRVYNPQQEEHGWQSNHTVIEVINDDMPFLIDSMTMEVNRQGSIVHLLIHPVMKIVRDAEHRLVRLARSADEPAGRFESLVRIEVERRSDPEQLDALRDGLLRVLGDVRAAVEDWAAMAKRVAAIIEQAEQAPARSAAGPATDEIAFLRWILDGNFILLGCRDYELVRAASDDDADELHVVPGSGLGILRERGEARQSRAFAQLPPHLRAYAREPNLLTLTKANARSTVHRPGYLDYIGVKTFDEQGRVIGERRVLGLFTSLAYSGSPTLVPLLRDKIAAVTQRAGLRPGSHIAKSLTTLLEQYPRDELFQIDIDQLHETALGILRLGERQRTRLFLRRDAFGRYYACLVYVPRDNYDNEVRVRMQQLLMEALQGTSSEFQVHLSDLPLARILFVIRTEPGSVREIDVRELERKLARAARRWGDEFAQALLQTFGERRGSEFHTRFGDGLSAGYREAHTPDRAVDDVEHLDRIDRPGTISVRLYTLPGMRQEELRFRIYGAGDPLPLSVSLPILEHLGMQVLEEQPYDVRRSDGQTIWIDDFTLAVDPSIPFDLDDLRTRFEQGFVQSLRGQCESDRFNRLILLSALNWQEVSMLRAYARFMKQAGFTFSQPYIEQALASHPAIAAQLVALFHARFDPKLQGNAATDAAKAVTNATSAAGSVSEAPPESGGGAASIAASIERSLDKVANLDEDRILRQFLAVIQATLRTNFYQHDVLDAADANRVRALSFKFDPAQVPLLPAPRPMFEIFVYSPRVEGVHLRGGKVARGGLRWSDRMEDFRTEVLGLVKAQQVKNAVIVPVGSKGGFVLKRPPPAGNRDALMAEGIACYQAYLRGLLDLTDNLDGGVVVPPPSLVRHDGDDPYLVVAADKGTAAFSDTANAVSAEYSFWLDDAFASGGSAGYDHKGMAITARGAWESTKRHFKALGRDPQSEPFTVAGIGDMSGDVFGNGMLRSRQIRLVAAFDHRHIFIDPDPDPASSFTERERLFHLPRSSWADYDATLISAGGGVYPRSAKAIQLSAQAREALRIEAESLTPTELIQAVLRAPVDLLYNGGIGTYVKAAAESNAEVGDRANDAVRIDGGELRCKVVVEGGNLGFTQRGRIEFALTGGLINTDAIDNSAGVDCSDHEVNIKILLNQLVSTGAMTLDERNRLLADMTDEVAQLVLRDNIGQNRILAVERHLGIVRLPEQIGVLGELVAAGRLDRELEFLPSDETLAERRRKGIGLCTPELALLLAYNKMDLYDQVLASDIPADAFAAKDAERYFPQRLRESYAQQIHSHPLRREIASNAIINDMVNRVGPTFTYRVLQEAGAGAADVVRAYLVAREIFGLEALWNAVEASEPHADAQILIALASARLARKASVWLLKSNTLTDIGSTIARYAGAASQVGERLADWLAPQDRSRLESDAAMLQAKGVDPSLARRVAGLAAQFSALEIAEVARQSDREIPEVAAVYFGLGGLLRLGKLSRQIESMPAADRWSVLARLAAAADLGVLARDLTRSVLTTQPAPEVRAQSAESSEALLDAWKSARASQFSRVSELLGELEKADELDLAMVSVSLRELRALVSS